MEDNYLELSDYGIQKTEAKKYRQLKRNLFVEGITDNLCMQMDEKYPKSGKRFTRVIKWLMAKVIQLDYHRAHMPKRKSQNEDQPGWHRLTWTKAPRNLSLPTTYL
jgi:hypothetical protein